MSYNCDVAWRTWVTWTSVWTYTSCTIIGHYWSQKILRALSFIASFFQPEANLDQSLQGDSYCWLFRNPKQPTAMFLKPCKYWDIYGYLPYQLISRFFLHQQYLKMYFFQLLSWNNYSMSHSRTISSSCFLFSNPVLALSCWTTPN